MGSFCMLKLREPVDAHGDNLSVAHLTDYVAPVIEKIKHITVVTHSGC